MAVLKGVKDLLGLKSPSPEIAAIVCEARREELVRSMGHGVARP